MKRLLPMLTILLTLVGLTACGGGGGGGGSTNSVNSAGYWSGTMIDNTSQAYPVLGLVSPDGELRFLVFDGDTISSQISGRITTDGNRATGNITAYALPGYSFGGALVVSGSISYTVIEKQSIAGAFSIPGQTGNFNLTYEPGAEMEVNQLDLQGNWGFNRGEDRINVAIDGAGNLTGIDELGCRMNGTAKVIDTNWNIYRLNFAVTQCGGFNGSYSGLSTIDSDRNPDAMLVMVSSPTTPFTDFFFYSATPWF